jgi:hypothetical protein
LAYNKPFVTFGLLCQRGRSATRDAQGTAIGAAQHRGVMTIDTKDPTTWPDATIVVRGGIGGVKDLRTTLEADGCWSVRSRPGVTFEALAGAVVNNQVRRTTVQAALALGATITPTDAPGDPPYHCDLSRLTAEQFDSILGAPELNPVPKDQRKR